MLDPGDQAGLGNARQEVGGRHHQARVVGGLERELDPPLPGDLVRRPAAAAGIRGVLGGTQPDPLVSPLRLDQPEAGAHRAGRELRGGVPGVQPGGKLRCLLFVFGCGDLDLAVDRRERHDPALGHRDAGRLASAAGGKQRLSGEPGPGDGVGEVIQRAGQDQGRRPIAGVGRAAHRRHPGGELTRAFSVGARQHRTPFRRVPAVLGAQRRQHPSPGRKISPQPRHRGQVTRAPTDHLTRERAGLAEHGKQVHGGGGLESQRGDPPGCQRYPAPGRSAGPRSVLTGRAYQLRRPVRPVRAGWQPQRQFVLDRLTGQARSRFGRRATTRACLAVPVPGPRRSAPSPRHRGQVTRAPADHHLAGERARARRACDEQVERRRRARKLSAGEVGQGCQAPTRRAATPLRARPRSRPDRAGGTSSGRRERPVRCRTGSRSVEPASTA